jgi:hemoglobin
MSESADLQMRPANVYAFVGGMETFRRIVDAFYRGVEADPVLRPMYPEELEGPRDRLALFLAQFFGGPRAYSESRGHPRLRMRHVPFQIGRAERDAWMRHMRAAIEEAAIPEPARDVMLKYFDDAATFLINQAE